MHGSQQNSMVSGKSTIVRYKLNETHDEPQPEPFWPLHFQVDLSTGFGHVSGRCTYEIQVRDYSMVGGPTLATTRQI